MTTVNFSVPDEINSRFSRTFKGRNKSAILSQLMERAIAEEEQRKRRIKAVDQLLELRRAGAQGQSRTSAKVTDAAIRKARERGRP